MAQAVEKRRRNSSRLAVARGKCWESWASRRYPIGAGPRREPVWPVGVAGTITHCDGYRAAAVSRTTDLAGIGIDAEPNAPLPPGVADAVTTAGESAMLAELSAADPAVHWDRLLFSAKESTYKAWFPLTGRMLDFDGALLTIDPETRSFRARLLVDGRRRDGGTPLTSFTGRLMTAGGLVLTAIAVPAAPAGA